MRQKMTDATIQRLLDLSTLLLTFRKPSYKPGSQILTIWGLIGIHTDKFGFKHVWEIWYVLTSGLSESLDSI